MMRNPSLVLMALLVAAPLAAQNPPKTPPPPTATTPAVAPAPGIAASGIPAPAAAPMVSFGMGLSCSNCTMSLGDRAAYFSTPPRVYSVERYGPADQAGLQRGDVIVSVNGKRITTEAGGKAFATVNPGEVVAFGVQRGSQQKVFYVRAAQRTPYPQAVASVAPALASTSRSIEEANRTMAQLQRSQNEQLHRLQQEAERAIQMTDVHLRDAQRRMLMEEQEHSRQLESLAREMAHVKTQMHAALADSMRGVCRPTVTAQSTRSRTLRYSGTLGSTNIEVRGSNPVNVTETDDEVVITTGATVVRLQKKK